MKLIKLLTEQDNFLKFKDQADQLEKELKDTYDRDDIIVSMGQYYKRDRGYGKVRFRTQQELSPAEWLNIKNFLEAKGFEITNDSNYYDTEDDRIHYPELKFEFDAK